MERETGIVLWFNGSYGFIQRKDGEGSIFVHQTNIRMPGFRTLVDGQPVEYEVAASEKGLTAINVVPLQE